MIGPPGCMQWLMTATGTVRRYVTDALNFKWNDMSYMYQRMIYLTRLYFVFYSFNFPDQTAGTVVSGAGKYMKILLVKIDPQFVIWLLKSWYLISSISILVTHLSNQKYDICIRQPISTTFICYIPCTFVAGTDGNNAAATAQVVSSVEFIHEWQHTCLY